MKYLDKIKPEILATLIMIGIIILVVIIVNYPKFAILSVIAMLIYGIWGMIVSLIKYSRSFK